MVVDTEPDEDDNQVEECPICSGDIIVDGLCEEGDIVYCNDCEAEFMIRSLDPLRLRLLDTDIDEPDDRYDEEYD
jgi:hypothetical protein